MVRRVCFQAGSSTPLHLIGVELEKVGDDFGFGRVGRKAAAKMEYPPSAASPRSGCPSRGAFPVNAAQTGKAALGNGFGFVSMAELMAE